jgi:triosephosphate isomerase
LSGTNVRRGLVVGNWKMNGGLAGNARLLGRLASEWTPAQSRELAVCVPAPYLVQAQAALTGSAVTWGAQDVSEHKQGAYTGEVSAVMLAEFGCRYAIVGHSERRQLHFETDAVVGAKARAALDAALVPIACVGETLAERERGETAAVIERQAAALIAAVGADIARIVLAYEPVWAIGTGRTASPEQAQAVHAALRVQLAAAGGADVRVLYGGSVKAANAAALFAMPDIDGGLVGGASLDADEFLTIARA